LIVFDGSLIEDLLWANGFDFLHFANETESWLEVYANGYIVRIYDTYPNEETVWVLDSENIEISVHNPEMYFDEYLCLDLLSEVELVEILLEFVP
jgi:hypothetical protein